MSHDNRHADRRRAFTMMEVLVVIVILSILLALTTTVVKRLMVTADIEKTQGNMKIAMEAIQKYRELKGEYPPTLEVLLKVPDCAKLLSNLGSGMLDSAGGVKDGFDKVMNYTKDGGAGGTPMLQSAGPDGVFGTPASPGDDIFSN